MNLLRKFLIAATVGAATFAFTTLAHQVPAWSWLLSVFVSGVALVVQFLIEMDSRLEVVRREVLGVAAAGKLFELPNSGPLSRDTLLHLVTHVTGFDQTMPTLAWHLADAEVDRVSNFLKDLSRGRQVIYDGDDWYWCLSLTIHARTSIDAATFSYGGDDIGLVDDDLWQSELGKRYLHLQTEAIERGVRVRRIFIVETSELISSPQFCQIVNQQKELGIQVCILVASNIPSVSGTIIPMVIFDDSVLYEQTQARFPGVPGYVKTTLVLQRPQVQAAVKQFQQLWSAGQFDKNQP